MPKSKLQNVLFTIVMAFVMVYALVCYNIALDKGGMSNEIFLIAFHEIVIMLPVAFVLEFFIVEICHKTCIQNCDATGQTDFYHTCYFFYDSVYNVSDNELYCNSFICTCR